MRKELRICVAVVRSIRSRKEVVEALDLAVYIDEPGIAPALDFGGFSIVRVFTAGAGAYVVVIG